MSRNVQRRVLVAFLVGIALVWLGGAAASQEAREAPDADPAAAPRSESEAQKPLREQTIYIPYEDLRKVFEKEGRGVFLSYEKFRELWDAAREKTTPPEPEKPPVAALITEIDNEATVSADVVRVEARLKIEVLAEGWSAVPLRLSDAAITSAELDGQPARVVPGEGGYKLLLEKKGPEPQQLELRLEFAKAITRMPGQNSVTLEAPQAPVSRWRVTIPEAGVKVNLQPLIAATEVLPEESDDPEAAAGKTTILAFVGAAPTVRIDWTPKAEGAAGLEALASVRTEQQVTIDEGVIRTKAQLAYTISRAELAELAIEVPGDHKVAGVFDANVRQWSVEPSGEQQKVTVQLFEPAKGAQNVVVDLEKFTSQEDSEGPRESTVAIPLVTAVGVGRQQGVLVVRLAEGLRAEALRSSGLVQVDAADLPAALARGQWAFSYRFATVPYSLELRVEKVQPRILVDSLVEAELTPERLSIGLLAVYTVQRAGVFRLELAVPEEFEVRQVGGREAAGAAAVEVDSHHVDGEGDARRLVVNLARKAFGRVALYVELERGVSEHGLDKPSESEAQIPLPVPQVPDDLDEVEQASGRLVISAPESLRVNPLDPKGLRSVSVQEAREGIGSVQGQSSAGVRPVLAYKFSREPASLVLAAQRRRPQLTIRQLIVANVENGVVKYDITLFYEVLYSGVPALAIDVPEDVASRLRVETPGISEKVVDLPPDQQTAGRVRWSLAGETELIGSGQIKLGWVEKDEIAGLDTEKEADLTVPRVFPVGVDRAWGQIVLVKAETIDVQAAGDLAGLRPIDPQYDLMPGAQVAGAAAAYEFHDEWTEPALRVTATRYELEEVKHTSIERAVLRMVITRAGKISVQALYRMRSARQRLVLEVPSGAKFDAEPRLDGRPVTLEIGQAGQYHVPLVGSGGDESFLLELRYTVENENANRLDCPTFPLEPAIQKVYLSAYLPDDWVLVERLGPWTEEFDWRPVGLEWVPFSPQSDRDLLRWVAEPIDLDDSFPTDGRRYLFSSLRPQDPPGGSLQLATADEDALNLAVVLLVLVGGLALVPARSGARAFCLGLLVIALVACGVFYPILAHQILDGVLAAAVLIVLVVWTVWHFLRTRPRRRKALAGSGQPPSPPAPDAASPQKAGAAASPFGEASGQEPPSAEKPIEAESVEPAEPPSGEGRPPESRPGEKPKRGDEEGGRTNA